MKHAFSCIILIVVICVLAFFLLKKDSASGVQYIISKPKVILIQPLGDFDTKLAKLNLKALSNNHYGCRLLKPIPHFPASYSKPRDRYRADSILKFLRYKYGPDTLVIALSRQDISATKKLIKDWGIMGLAHSPGNVCVVSAYRLVKDKLAEQLYKVSIHELGHTQGLPHCPDTTCYMRDASGGNPLNSENDFCAKCKKFMQLKGWKV